MGVRDDLAEMSPEMLFIDPEYLDAAIVGSAEVWRNGACPLVAVYDRGRILSLLIERGMTPEGAQEHFSFNIAGTYAGPYTPVIVSALHPCTKA